MGILRTYFSKDTTIIKNSCVNTGSNPIVELFHGGSTNINNISYSRYLLDIDLDSIIEKSNCVDVGKMSHKIYMTNTSCFDRELTCETVCSSVGDARRATSFDLVLFEIPQKWDEGNGYDYTDSKPISGGERDITYCESPANWYDSQTGVEWSQPGVYTGSSYNIISEQHFDHGNENLCIDITDYINNLLLTGDTSNFNGIGLAFKRSQESMVDGDTFYVGFFGKETNTVYEPYVETVYDDVVKDDRDNFYLDKNNRLYLYTSAGGELVNATFSGVNILDDDEKVYQTIPPSGITQQSCGVYYVDVNIPSSGYCGNLMFNDIWEDVTIDGNNLGNSEQEFILQEESDYYSVGSTKGAATMGLSVDNSTNLTIYDYDFRVSGVRHQEKIKRGDTRRINVQARIPLTYDSVGILDGIKYRIYIREGNTQIDYIDWTEVSRAYDGNFFIMDTSWFIPNDYYLEVKLTSGNEIRTYDEVIKFTVVSEKKLC